MSCNAETGQSEVAMTLKVSQSFGTLLSNGHTHTETSRLFRFLFKLFFYSVSSTSIKSAHYQTFSDPKKGLPYDFQQSPPPPHSSSTHCHSLLKRSSNCFSGFSFSRLPHCFQSLFARNMTLKGASNQACGACKYQRRKCTSECPLAPYFPPDQPKMFQNAHKLFGVGNILKIIKNLDPSLKVEAMSSIIYEANVRDKFPVYGCWEVIWQLQYQILLAEEELQAVQTQLAMYRQHHHQHQISSVPEYVTSQLELGMAPPNNSLPLFNHNPQPYDNNNNNAVPALPLGHHHHHQQHSYSNSSDAAYIDSKDHNAANPLWVSNPCTTNNSSSNNNSETIQSQLGVLQPLSLQPVVVQDYDELHPFFDTIDHRQSYIDSKEAYESSSEESFKDTTQSMEHTENALKNAAACFSLTSVN